MPYDNDKEWAHCLLSMLETHLLTCIHVSYPNPKQSHEDDQCIDIARPWTRHKRQSCNAHTRAELEITAQSENSETQC